MNKITVILTLFVITCNNSCSRESNIEDQQTMKSNPRTTPVSQMAMTICPKSLDVMEFVEAGPRVGDFYKDKEGRKWKAISIFEGEGGQGKINVASYHPELNRSDKNIYFYKLKRERTLVNKYQIQIPIVIGIVLDVSTS